jgi:hypothetical protein
MLYSVGNIGIANINGRKVDRYIKGYIKYRLHPQTRTLFMILEPAPNKIFAFYYRFSDNKGVMDIYAATGDEYIDNYMSTLKEKDKQYKDNYQINDSDIYTFKTFVREYFTN